MNHSNHKSAFVATCTFKITSDWIKWKKNELIKANSNEKKKEKEEEKEKKRKRRRIEESDQQ